MELLRMDDKRYDVFICFRGDEPFGTTTIRTAIVEPLFDSLTGIGASVFMDDETIEPGRDIPDAILQGILRTRGGGAALILVSPDFFGRVWPMIEMACLYRLRNRPNENQIHLFVVCFNMTPEQIKQDRFVTASFPQLGQIKFVVPPIHVDPGAVLQFIQYLSDTVETWIRSNFVALGQTRTESFGYFKSRLVNLPNQLEISQTFATQLGFRSLLIADKPCSLSIVLATAEDRNLVIEDNLKKLLQLVNGLLRDMKYLDSVHVIRRYMDSYTRKWLKLEPEILLLQHESQRVRDWFVENIQVNATVAVPNHGNVAPQQPLAPEYTLASQAHAPTSPPLQTVQIIANENENVRQLNNLFDAAVALGHQVSAIVVAAVFLAFINNIPVAQAFGFGSLYLAFRKEDADLASIQNNPKVQIVTADNGVEFEIDATNTWSWPLTLDEHGVLNDHVQNKLAVLIASFALEGKCKFRVHRIQENNHFAVFFIPSQSDIDSARSIFEQEGFMDKFEQAYNTFDTIAKDQVAFCGGCGVVQRTSPENSYMCRLGHLQAWKTLDQKPLNDENVGWMPHNRDLRVDLLISCEQNDEIVSSLKDCFLHDTYSVITSENRDMSSFLQAVLSTRGGGIALVLMTKNYMIQSRTISELACLYAVRQDIRLIIACVGTTKSQVLQNVIIQELCPDLSSHLFLEYDTEDSVDSFLKNQIFQELLQHVIPGFRRDQSYLILKNRLAACFANSPGRVFAKIAIKLDLESVSVMNWSDLFKQAELHGKFGEEQMDQLRQAIVMLPDTEVNSNDRTAALKIIQQYENKWLADWTSKEVPALDEIGERAHIVNSRSRAPLYKTLTGHTNWVWSVAFSPNDKLVASASNDNTVRLWNIPSGDLNAELKGHTNSVDSVAFSPDGQSIVTGSWDNTVRTWSIATKQQAQILNGHTKTVYSVAWSPNGDLIASGSEDKSVILWDAISGSVNKKLTGHTDWAFSVSFSQNGNKLASGAWDNIAIIWDVHSGATLIKLAHSSYVYSVCFSRDDQFVVSGCADGIVRMFNAKNGHEEKRFEGHTNGVRSVACSFDGSIIASGSCDNSVRLWDVASTKQLQKLDGHGNLVNAVACSRDGKFIASGSKDKTVCLWNAPSSLQTPTSLLKSACFAGDVDAAKFQLDQGALVNNKDGSTALYAASSKGSKQLVELLIERGADINFSENNGSSALHAASYHGHQEVVAYLLDCGLSINDKGNGVSSSDETHTQQSKKRQRYNESNCFARETVVNHDDDAMYEDGHSFHQMTPNVDQVLQQYNDDSDSDESSVAYSNSAQGFVMEDNRSQDMESSTTSSSEYCPLCRNIDITNSENSKLGEQIADKMDELWRNNHAKLDPLVLSDPEQIGEKGLLWYCHRDVKITRSAKNSKGQALGFKVGNIEGQTQRKRHYTTQLAHDVDMSRFTSVRDAYNNLRFYDSRLFAQSHRPCTMMPFATSVELPPEIKKTIVDQIPSYSEKALTVFTLPIREDVENPFTLEKYDFWIMYDPPKKAGAASKAKQRTNKVQYSPASSDVPNSSVHTPFMNPASADLFFGFGANYGSQCD